MNPFTLEKSIPRSVKMLQNMINPDIVAPDKAIPLTLLRHCEGVAFIRIYKAGLFMLGGNLGGGVVIAKVQDPNEETGYRWSAPVSIQCGGLGGGFVFGGEQIDSIVILNTKSAIRAFTGKGQLTFGGNVSLAVGPVGRDIEAHVGASDNRELIAAYSYSQAKGAYIGGTLEGAILFVKDDENKSFYENPGANAEALLAGTVRPPFKGQSLGQELAMVIGRKGPYAKLESSKSMRDQRDLASSGRDLVKQGLSSSSGGGDLAPGWQEAVAPDGKVYYYNVETQATQWDKPLKPKPVAAAAPPPPVFAAPVPAAAGPAIPARPVIPARPSAQTATALYDYKAVQADELSIVAGDKVEVLEKIDANWWKGRVKGRTGLVPATYLQV